MSYQNSYNISNNTPNSNPINISNNTVNNNTNNGNNNTPNSISQLNQQVDQTKEVLLSACNKLVDRGESLDHLQDKAVDLNMSAHTFQRNSRSLRNKMWWKEKKMMLISILIIIIILLIIILPIVYH